MDITPVHNAPPAAAGAFSRRVVLLSPIAVVGLGFILARVTISLWGEWSWIPVILYYWAALVGLVAWAGGREALRRWLKQPSRPDRWMRRWTWALRILALVIPPLFLATGFLPGLASLNGPWVPLAWFGLGAANAWIEEGYWRGLLLDAASGWPGWLGNFYSALFFGASHALVFGYREDALTWMTGFAGTLLAGLIWGFVYHRTRSLRLPVLGHTLQQILAPPYHVFEQLAALLG